MKIREGYVSNSSSTSFVLCGEMVSLRDVVLESGKDYVAIESEYADDGYTLYELTAEYLELFPFLNGDFQIWAVAFSSPTQAVSPPLKMIYCQTMNSFSFMSTQ